MTEKTKLEQEIEAKKAALEKLKKESSLHAEKEKIDAEYNQVQTNIQKAQLRAAHPKLFSFTHAWENFFRRFFKGLGKGLKKAAEAGNKADAWIAKEQAKENVGFEQREKPKKIDAVKDALEGVD